MKSLMDSDSRSGLTPCDNVWLELGMTSDELHCIVEAARIEHVVDPHQVDREGLLEKLADAGVAFSGEWGAVTEGWLREQGRMRDVYGVQFVWYRQLGGHEVSGVTLDL